MPEDATNNNQDSDLEECKGGDCPLSPQFEEGTRAPDARKVRLTTSKYVQLLIDARETDPRLLAAWTRKSRRAYRARPRDRGRVP
jgi:hypothetical protein